MRVATLLVLGLIMSCAVEDSEPTDSLPEYPFSEVAEAGILKYLDLAKPVSETQIGDSTIYEWDTKDGPMCLRGSPYRIAVRENPASQDLLIFLGGGGACWSDFCFAFEAAGSEMPLMQALNPNDPENPFKEFSVAFLHYCDGSLFAGDVEYDDDGDGTSDRFQYGLKNLSVAMGVVAQRFPQPKRVILAGASGGGYGTIAATFLVRSIYPGHPLTVINDSGVGIAKGENEPNFVKELFAEFNAEQFLPASCPECLANGHLTGLIGWQLAHDPLLTVVPLSFLRDTIIGTLFLKIGADAFEAALKAETTRFANEYPGRYVPFLLEGSKHTMLAGDLSVFLEDIPEGGPDLSGVIELGGLGASTNDGTTISQWLHWMLDGDPRWTAQLQ